jgi:hypothetical protein
MRKSAIRTTAGIAVVWSIKASTLEQTKILIYEGQAKLTKIGDEELMTQHTWLKSEQYDIAVRDAIDELWEEVEKRDMWYAMGASVGKYTTMGISGDEWEMEHDDGTTKTIGKNELIIMLHEQAKDVKWAATEDRGHKRQSTDSTRHRKTGQQHQNTDKQQLAHSESINTSDEHGKLTARKPE